jgi:CRISPR-associated protein Cas1
MRGRVLEISGEPRTLSSYRGFLVVSEKANELGKIDIEGINSILISSKGSSITSGAIELCSINGIPITHCGKKYSPISVTYPLIVHSIQSKRIKDQINAPINIKNKIWENIIKNKIKNQANVLKHFGSLKFKRLEKLSIETRLNDIENKEAQAARIYWQELFGNEFRRDKNGDGINILLNYGYAIIRNSILKATISNGLHPTIGIHHSNNFNPFCLADDIMEPYRPMVDCLVKMIVMNGSSELNPTTKSFLAALIVSNTDNSVTSSSVFQNMIDFCYSISKFLSGDEKKLPFIFLPKISEFQTILKNVK